MSSDIQKNFLDDNHLLSDEVNFDEIDDDLAAFQEDEMVKLALQRGVDLKKYGRELEKELKAGESELIVLHVENNPKVVELHKQMQECDAVLARMQDMLEGFQADLGGISEEIKHLQDESLSMNIKLKNRRSAEEMLNKFLQNSGMTPEQISAITSGTVNEVFVDAVVNLGNKLKYLQQSSAPKDGSSLDVAPNDTFAGQSILVEYEKLKIRAIAKARDYFISKFSALRKPKTNVQILQQSSLLKYSPLFNFIQQEFPNVAEELQTVYVESMGRTLYNLFKSYYSQLLKFDLILASKSDLVVVEEAALKSLFSNKMAVNKKYDTFSLGDRNKILDQIESEPILVHVALAEQQKYPYEALLRSVIKHLSDAATNEFLFVLDFFKSTPKDTFNRIFGRTLSLILESIENYLLNCFDAVGLLLMIRITHLQRLIMQRRRIPTLDPFFDRISMLLWPRFKQVFDANVKSIKGAHHKRLGPVDLTPHFVSRRFAELVASVLTLQSGYDNFGVGGGGDSMIQHDLQILRTEMIGLLERLSSLHASNKDKKVFLINNYDQILSILQEHEIAGEEVQKFEDLLMQQRELFAEEEVKASFGKLIAFVIQTEQALALDSSRSSSVALDEVLVENLAREFAGGWRTGIQKINDDVILYFANFRSGTEILKQVLTQLLLYYTRFQDIIKKSWSRPPSFTRDIVSTATILMEIKKYSRTF